MVKAEKGSIKDLSNRMKAKGLQKLKFYCQMCNKQCRDANGFKCHLTSLSHLNQMKLFCSSSAQYLDEFSSTFESMYLDTLYRRHRTKKVNANDVYQQVIQDKDHIHMNATKWNTLTDFIQYLGKNGKCVVEESERGWYVTFIERDPTILAQETNYKKRIEAEKLEEENVQKRLEIQRKEAARILEENLGVELHVKASNISGSDVAVTMKMDVNEDKKKKKKKKTVASVFASDDDDDDNDDDNDNEEKEQKIRSSNNNEKVGNSNLNQPLDIKTRVEGNQLNLSKGNHDNNSNRKRRRNHDDCVNNPKQQKQDCNENNDDNSTSQRHHNHSHHHINNESSTSKSNSIKDTNQLDLLQDIRKKYWIQKDILVRIISKKLDNDKTISKTNKSKLLYKRKCIIQKVYDKYTAKIETLDSSRDSNDGGVIFKVDQDDLETVVPKVGKKVLILNGKGRGLVGELLSVDEKKCRGSLKVTVDGCDAVLNKVDFDDFSKLVL